MRRRAALTLLLVAALVVLGPVAAASAGPAASGPSSGAAGELAARSLPPAEQTSTVSVSGVTVVIPAVTDARMRPGVAFLKSHAQRVLAIDALRWTVGSAWASLFVLTAVLAGLALWRGRAGGRARRWAALGLLAPLVFPLAGYALAAVPASIPLSSASAGLVFTAYALLFSAVVMSVGWRWGARRAAVGVLGVTATVVALDQLAGAPLLLANVFGYSLAQGGRYFGLGNEGAGLLLGYSVAAVALLAPPPEDPAASRTAALAGALFAAALVICIAPWWGANIGVVVWGAVLLLVSWQGTFPAAWPRGRVWIAAAGVAVVAVAFVVADTFLQLTHVGRYVAQLVAGGGGAASAQLAERVGTAVRTTVTNPWSLLLLLVILGMVWVRVRPPANVAQAFGGSPAARAYFTATLAATLAAFLVEDTPGSIGAFLAPVALVVLLIVLLSSEREEAVV